MVTWIDRTLHAVLLVVVLLALLRSWACGGSSGIVALRDSDIAAHSVDNGKTRNASADQRRYLNRIDSSRRIPAMVGER
jgi:hypothetical protein